MDSISRLKGLGVRSQNFDMEPELQGVFVKLKGELEMEEQEFLSRLDEPIHVLISSQTPPPLRQRPVFLLWSYYGSLLSSNLGMLSRSMLVWPP
jgi:hypothetical protein